MNMLHTPARKTALSAAIALALGVGATMHTTTASAKELKATWTGVFTLINPAGAPNPNGDYATETNWYGWRTPVSGTMTFDTSTGIGSATVVPFSFAGGGAASATAITMQALAYVPAFGDPTSTLVLGNMGFNWSGNLGIPVSIVLDAAGFFGCMGGPTPAITGVSSTCAGVGASPASDNTQMGGTPAKPNLLPIGPSPMAAVTQNTTAIGSPGLGSNPSGTIPVVPDATTDTGSCNLVGTSCGTTQDVGVGGSPMAAGPFPSWNANFDITSIHVTSLTSAVDTTKPTIAVTGGAATVTQNDPYGAAQDAGAVCSDNVDPDKPADEDFSAINTANLTPPAQQVTYTCTDAAGNVADPVTRNVNVVAAGTPSITLTGSDVSGHECATAYTDAGATASDPEDGDITSSIVTANGVNVNAVGSYTVTYDVSDSSSNAAPQVARNVTVVDTTGPVVTPTGANPLILETTDEAGFTNPGATALDACGNTTPIVTQGGSVNFDVPDGQDTVNSGLTYTAVDAAGNSTTVTRSVTVQRAEPVVTLVGAGNQSIALNGDFTDEGVVVSDVQEGQAGYSSIPGAGDFAPDATGPYAGYLESLHVAIGFEAASQSAASAGKQTAQAATPVNAVDTSQPGVYTLTYTTTDKDGNDSAPITRTVTVGAAFSAKLSNFTMINPKGNFVGGAKDIVSTWDKSLYTDPATQTAANMTLLSETPTPFFGSTWQTTAVRVFGPGTYEFEACPPPVVNTVAADGSTQCAGDTKLKVTVGPGQIGAHMLFDWPLNAQNQVTSSTSRNIDVFVVWEKNAVFQGSPADSDTNLGAKGATWDLASVDGDGDGIPGIQMVDGPFKGFRANFNLSEEGVAVDLPPEPHAVDDADTGGGSGSADGWTLAGLMAGVAGLLRRRRRQ